MDWCRKAQRPELKFGTFLVGLDLSDHPCIGRGGGRTRFGRSRPRMPATSSSAASSAA